MADSAPKTKFNTWDSLGGEARESARKSCFLNFKLVCSPHHTHTHTK